ncbi:MAG TPA: acyl-CoA dehydrogenase family protein [Polyangiaceae bacterium]
MLAERITDHPDGAALLAQVDRFAEQVIEPRVARADASIGHAAFAEALAEADSLGLAGDDATPSGLAPWDELGGAPGPSLAVLRRLSRANSAFALAIHARALARAVLRSAGLAAGQERPAIVVQGAFGLGRTALARLLAGRALDVDDVALLADVYGPAVQRIVPLDPTFDALLTLVFEHGELSWRAYTRAELVLIAEAHAHGLDELSTTRVCARTPAAAYAPAAPAELVTILAVDQLALVAIGVGAVERAHALARRFAAERRQGGAVIGEHAAVRLLLAKTRSVIDVVDAQLAAHGDRLLTAARLGHVLGLRAEAMPALADAAHASMQVFGGLGYMRDTGIEKVTRDVNALRALAGTPGELALLVSEWERLHD